MIKLVEFSDDWKKYFLQEKEHLLDVLRGQKVLEVEHIGATSVVLCKTTGTIDLMCVIPNSIEFITIKNLLCSKDYQYLPSFSTDECYVYARRNEKKQIVATVRVVEQASLAHKELILFKAYLRQTDRHVINYNKFRQSLIYQFANDARKYQEIKRNYIRSILHDFCEVK